MVFPVVGGDGKPTGYEISNSLRFNDGDSPALTRTMGTPTSTRKFTYAGWLKRSEINANQNSFLSWGGSTYATDLRYESGSDSLYFFFDDNTGWYAKTESKYRDVSAWYQVVLAVDTTQATESNRVKLYVNGTQYGPALDGTDWTQHEIFGQNYDFPELANGQTMAIGKRNSSGSHFFDGYMSEIYFIDGQALDSSYFGETNDNGVWIPKEYTGTYGNNGFLLEFKQTGTSQNSSGIGADTSGNDNHFAVSNLAATDVTTDTPTNNFATLNPLDRHANVVLSEGNLQTVNTSGGGHYPIFTNMAFRNGKWYAEFKRADGNNWKAAIMSIEHDGGSLSVDSTVGNSTSSVNKVGYGINVSNGNKTHNTTNASYGSEIGSILMWAFDADNGKIWWGEDGTWFASGDPAAGSNEAFSSIDTDTLWTLAFHTYNGHNLIANFGNAPFAISSGNADANGYGNFEYAVPSGFYSLCTKNLAEYG